MGYAYPDVYYNPDQFGLTVIGDVQWGTSSYDFNLTVVWQDADGKIYWASDSGCSCPSPFEDFTKLEDLDSGTVHEAAKELTDRLAIFLASEYRSPREKSETQANVVDLLDTLMNL